MSNITNYETKEIECDKCGWVGTVAKHIPLKQAWCGGCRSSRIRLHKRPTTKAATDVAYCSCPEFVEDVSDGMCKQCGLPPLTRRDNEIKI
jgi:hypothetical protein